MQRLVRCAGRVTVYYHDNDRKDSAPLRMEFDRAVINTKEKGRWLVVKDLESGEHEWFPAERVVRVSSV